MILKSLSVKDFRNLSPVTIEMDPSINVIYGKNAQGKTNLMESIWLFTGNKSFRGAKDSEMIAFDERKSILDILFFSENRDQSAQIVLGEKKSQNLNKVPLRSVTEFSGKFCAVVFSPTDLSFIKDGPEKRRKFLDLAIVQIKPLYRNYLNQYYHTLAQRNALVKDSIRHPELSGTIFLWDAQLAKIGTIITSYRKDYIKKLNQFSKEFYDGISGGNEQLELHYVSTIFEEEYYPKYEEKDILFYESKLSGALDLDQKLGFTSIGIHRDDIEVTINGKNAKTYGSQGQQRSSVLSIKLGESEMIRHILGEAPIMILDDVMSELDPQRQEYILNHLDHNQVFLSCCDVSNTLQLKGGSIFYIDNGMVKKER